MLIRCHVLFTEPEKNEIASKICVSENLRADLSTQSKGIACQLIYMVSEYRKKCQGFKPSLAMIQRQKYKT